MDHFAAIDVSLEVSSVCVVDATGRIVREAKVASKPEALSKFFGKPGLAIVRIGLEAGPLSHWLHGGRVAGNPDRDASRQGGALGDAGKNRPLLACTNWVRIAPVGTRQRLRRVLAVNRRGKMTP